MAMLPVLMASYLQQTGSPFLEFADFRRDFGPAEFYDDDLMAALQGKSGCPTPKFLTSTPGRITHHGRKKGDLHARLPSVQHVATAAAINAYRLSDWLEGVPRAATRTSRFARPVA